MPSISDAAWNAMLAKLEQREKCIRELEAENIRLRGAIETHRKKDSRVHENGRVLDRQLWSVLDE